MLTLNATQQTLVDGTNKTPIWSFIVTDINSNKYYWSNETYTVHGDSEQWGAGEAWASGEQWSDGAGGSGYTFKILDFPGLKFNRNKNELDLIAPSDGTFKVSNSGNTLTAANFDGADFWINLEILDGTNIATVGHWRFRIKKCDHNPDQTLTFNYETYLQKYLMGSYPNTRLIKGLFVSSDTDSDNNACVPVIFGTPYIPIRSAYITSARYYILGLAANTYTIDRVRSPREWGGKSEWLASGYTMTQSSKTGADGVSYKVLQPIIADSDNDGTADATGLWQSGDHFLDMPCKYSSSATSTMTSPADIISYVLQDMGVPVNEIDIAGTFATVKTSLASKGIAWNFGLWYKEDRQKVLAKLLTMCHCGLRQGQQIELYEKVKASVKTITSTEVLTTNADGTGPAIFNLSKITGTISDGGYIAYQPTNEAQDKFIKVLVPAKGLTVTYEDSEVLEVPAIQDSQKAQKLGTLYYQRKLMKVADATSTVKGTCLAIQPDDVITFNNAAFGGTFNALVDSVNINLDLKVDLACSAFKVALDDWADLSPAAITITQDNSTDYWTPSITGPLSDQNIAQNHNLFFTDEWVVISPITNKGKFTNLADALTYINNSPADSGKIFCKNGTYATELSYLTLIDKNLTIEGESQGGVIFNGKSTYHFFNNASAITKIFNFLNFTVNILSNNTDRTAFLNSQSDSSNFTISQIKVVGNSYMCEGINLNGSNGYCQLINNILTNIGTGIDSYKTNGMILNNQISINYNANYAAPIGITANFSNGSVRGNNIVINNTNNTPAKAGLIIYGNLNIVSDNYINLTNNNASEYGIIVSGNNNNGSGNVTYNVGTSISDLGTGNTVTAKDV